MKKIVLLLFLNFGFIGCNTSQVPEGSNQVQKGGDISVEKAEKMLAENDLVVLDVRTPEEYKDGHLEAANCVDFLDNDFEEKIDKLPKDQTYLIYCRSGARSSKAYKIMQSKGFEVYNMEGGFMAWKSANKKYTTQ